MGADNILRRYVLEHEIPRVLAEAHEGIAGGHYTGKSTAQKVLHRTMVADDSQRLEGVLSEMRCLSKGR
jgi:hypothetical protein